MEDLSLQTALDGWIKQNPGAKPCDFVAIFLDDFSVIGPFPSGEKAMEQAYTERPKGAPHICSIGGPNFSHERLRASGSR